jgi:hypothetical protein
MRLVTFVTPALIFGTTDFEDDIPGFPGSESAVRFMIGGGVGIFNSKSPIMLNVGAQYIAIENGGAQIGVALMFGR